MKTKARARKASSEPLRIRIKGRRMVALEESEYERLRQKADEWEPTMPTPDADGTYPALESLAVLQARDILRARRRLCLTQAELARLAGIRAEILNRIEQGKHKPNVATMGKIDRALKAASEGPIRSQ
jgi:DNA-binding XRE family transcriptional regulator